MHFVPGSAIGPIFSATVEKGKKVLDMEMKRQDLSARSLTLGLPPCILAVDDDEMSLMMIERILGESYEIVKVTSGKDALAYLSEHTVDLVLLDYMMPENDGITVLRRIRETLETADLPVILLTGDMTADLEARGFQAGATDFLHKPFFPDVLRLRVARILRYEYLQTHLEIEVEHKTALAEERLASSERLLRELILALAKTVDVKDRYTSGHSERVATYAREIARRAGDGEKAQETIYAVGLLHDIGKIGVPIDIINKTSRLTDEEYELVKAHTTAGASILKTVSEFPALSVGARSHHERYDGRGYPDGLKGEDIPRMARIIAVADAYDAMTSRRSYRDALPQDVARSEIVKGRGTQFDPQFADIMLQMIDEDTEYMMRDSGSASNLRRNTT